MILRQAWRELCGRRQRLLLLLTCIGLGVMARVLVGSALADTQASLQREARQLVGYDIALSQDRPLEAEQLALLHSLLPPGSRETSQRSLMTMAAREDDTDARLVFLRSVAADWPLRGSVEVEDNQGQRRQGQAALQRLLTSGTVLVEPSLLGQLGLRPGEKLRLGQASFRINGLIHQLPGGEQLRFSAGPQVVLAQEDLERTGLSGFAARVTESHFIALPLDQDPQALAQDLRQAWGLPEPEAVGMMQQFRPSDSLRLHTAAESLTGVQRFLDTFSDFLRMLALFALLLGAIGLAQLIRASVLAGLEEKALLQVLGMPPRRILHIVAVQVCLLGLAGGLFGVLLATLIYALLVSFFAAWLPISLSGQPHLFSMIWGLLLGLLVALVAGLPPVLALRRLAPLSILRGDLARLPGDRLGSALIHGAGLVLLLLVAAYETRSWRLGPLLIAVCLACALLILGLSWLVQRLLIPLARRMPDFAIRHGMAHVSRPQALAAMLALGLAAAVLGVLAAYRSSLSHTLSSSLAGQAPSLYALGIHDSSKQDFRALAEESGAAEILIAPMVSARLRAINHQPLTALPAAPGRERQRQEWFRSREQRLSWREQMGPDERIIAGRWMSAESLDEASISEEFHRYAGVALGDELTFDIQGVEQVVRVTSIRSVDWLKFRPNFFVLISPRSLDQAPRQWIASLAFAAASPEEQRMRLQGQIARAFPEISLIDVAQQVEGARSVIARMAIAIIFLAAIAMLSGLAVVVGVCAVSAHERRQDAALLRVCGASDRSLRRALITEFVLMSGLASLLGLMLSSAAAWLILRVGLGLEPHIPWIELALLASALITATLCTGLFASRRVLHAPPLAVLRASE